MKTIRKTLTIAGFDSSGGAGLQADLKTFTVLGCYGMTILTALPIQNTCGVRSYYDIPLQAISDQLTAVFEDIKPDCIKIGMLFSADVITVVADYLRVHAAGIPIILDPVMIAKSGDRLLQEDAMDRLKTDLIPLCTLITPNLPEAYALVGYQEDINILADQVLALGSRAALIKGGHAQGDTSDDFYIDRLGDRHWLTAKRLNSRNTHGTGCTLSAAICAYIARGYSMLDSCKLAKKYLWGAIFSSKDGSLGLGQGPVNHLYML